MHILGQIIDGMVFVLVGIFLLLRGYGKIRSPVIENPEKEKRYRRKLKYMGFTLTGCGLFLVVGHIINNVLGV